MIILTIHKVNFDINKRDFAFLLNDTFNKHFIQNLYLKFLENILAGNREIRNKVLLLALILHKQQLKTYMQLKPLV